MAETSKIEWCDATWNPWQGCHKISEGCDNCYMHTDKKRYGKDPSVVIRSKPPTFNAPLKWHKKILKEGTKNMRVFTCSWSDFFIEEADDWRADAWDIIRATPHITYLILTKRIEVKNVLDRLPKDFNEENFGHTWLGVTVENQEQADKRIPLLLRFKELYPWLKVYVSIEPMLGKVDLTNIDMRVSLKIAPEPDDPILLYDALTGHLKGPDDTGLDKLDWVILGGENGTGARPMHPDWVRKIRDDCKVAGVPFFFKGWGEYLERSIGKKKLGHLLDGVEYKDLAE